MIRLCRSGWPRTWVGIRYANVWGVNINDPECNITVSVMLGFTSFSVVFCTHKIYIRRRKQWCLRLTVCHFHVQNTYYSTMPIQFPFYGTFKLRARGGELHGTVGLKQVLVAFSLHTLNYFIMNCTVPSQNNPDRFQWVTSIHSFVLSSGY